MLFTVGIYMVVPSSLFVYFMFILRSPPCCLVAVLLIFYSVSVLISSILSICMFVCMYLYVYVCTYVRMYVYNCMLSFFVMKKFQNILRLQFGQPEARAPFSACREKAHKFSNNFRVPVSLLYR